MSISDTWRAHLKAIVDSLAPDGSKRARRAAYRQVADLADSNEEYVYQVYTGRAKPGEDFATSVEEAFGEGKPKGWMNVPLLGESQDLPTDQAHPLSESDLKLTRRVWTWKELGEMKTIPASFEVTLGDGAMAPEFPAGMRVEFEASKGAAYGECVIVRDERGDMHFRLCQQAAGGSWEAIATARGFRTLKPQEGAKIVAQMTGYFVSKRRSG